jgi:hypothetical protein
MAEPSVQDLLGVDRDVARSAAAIERWRREQRTNPEAGGDETLALVRHVASRATWAALGETSPSPADGPLRDALRQWVVALTQARIGAPAEAAWARAAAAATGHFEGEPPRRLNWRDAWRGVVAAPGAAEARVFLAAAASAAEALAAAARARASRRLEVARRFGFEHPWNALVPGVRPEALRSAARRLLDATEMISEEAWRVVWREAGAGAAVTLSRAVARDAGEGWPARLTPRWLQESFAPGATRGLVVEIGDLPQAQGASSFARALQAFGYALRLGAGSRMPFALAREPGFVAAHRSGFVFAALTADPVWQSRVLGVGRRVALAQARVLARTALLDVRLSAARLLLGDEAAFAPQDLFDELGPRLFGGPLDSRLRGAWPAAQLDEPARFVALLQTLAMSTSLRERFDVDWFRNPRAWEHLRAQAASPARHQLETEALDGQVTALARAFEEALG